MRLAVGILLVLASLPVLDWWQATGWTPLAFLVAALAFPGFHLIESYFGSDKPEPPIKITVRKEW